MFVPTWKFGTLFWETLLPQQHFRLWEILRIVLAYLGLYFCSTVFILYGENISGVKDVQIKLSNVGGKRPEYICVYLPIYRIR